MILNSLTNKLLLAPMAGITDLPFRSLCYEFGAALCYSEMISAKALSYQDKKTLSLLVRDEKPLAVQLFGSQPEVVAHAVSILGRQFELIDINMGCPAPKIVNNNEGSALMKNPDLIYNIVKSAVACGQVPITVKLRAGWDEHSVNVLECAKAAETAGAAAITVHPRTRSQQFSGTARLDLIRLVKQNVSVPVIGNGDVRNAVSYHHMLNYTGCDYVMIGRAALGAPQIFREILLGTPPLTLEQRMDLLFRHVDMLIDAYGERNGVRVARKHMLWYVSGIYGASAIKRKLAVAASRQQIKEIITTEGGELRIEN